MFTTHNTHAVSPEHTMNTCNHQGKGVRGSKLTKGGWRFGTLLKGTSAVPWKFTTAASSPLLNFWSAPRIWTKTPPTPSSFPHRLIKVGQEKNLTKTTNLEKNNRVTENKCAVSWETNETPDIIWQHFPTDMQCTLESVLFIITMDFLSGGGAKLCF